MDRTRRLLASLLALLLLLSAAGPTAAAESDTSDIILFDTFITLFVYEGAADISVSFGIDSTDQALIDEILDPDELRSTAAESAAEFGVPDSAVTVGELLIDPYPSREVYLEGLDATQVEGFLGDANELFRFLSVEYVQGFWILTATLAPLSEASGGDFAEDQIFANLWLQGPEGGRVQGDHDGEELDELLLAWEWDHHAPVDATATIEVPLASAATEPDDDDDAEDTDPPREEPSEEAAEDPTDEPATGLQADEDDRQEDDDDRAAAAADGGGVPPWVWILVGVLVLALIVALVIALTRGRSGKSGGQGPWQGGPGGYGGPGGQQGGYPPYGPQGGYPPQQGGYPPQQGGYPPQQGGYPPPPGGYRG